MEESVWTLDGHLAHLHWHGLRACVDVLRPGRGLSAITYLDQEVAGVELFRLELAGPDAPISDERNESLVDYYIRGRDLVATYAETSDRSVRPQIYWRAIATADGAAGLEMVLSMQTSSLDGIPTLRTGSQLRAAQVLRLTDAAAETFAPVPSDGPYGWDASQGESLIVVRLAQADLSYGEMVYPSDFVEAELAAASDASGHYVMHYSLFPEHLEKGVIRRGRIRGVFLKRQNDLASAATEFRRFMTAPPPLTT